MMHLEIIKEIERVRNQKLTIGQKQHIISLINLFRETTRNAEANMIQILTRHFSVPQNEFIDTINLVSKIQEFMQRPLTDGEINFIRQTETIKRSSIVQIQANLIIKLTSLSGIPQSALESLLIRHKLYIKDF